MANTQTTVPLFVANQVLTAAQQNTSAGTGVPVFATTVTRDAAFGGSNKALAEGQLCYIEASNVVQYYDGAAWATVGPSGCDIVQASTAFTTSSTINVDNVFTTTYKMFLILVDITARSTSLQVFMKMRVGGVNSSAGYYLAQFGGNYASAAMIFGSRANNGTSGWPITTSTASTSNPIVINISDPADVQSTNMSGTTPEVGNGYNYFFGGNHQAVTAYDGFSFITSTGTISGSYSIFGYK